MKLAKKSWQFNILLVAEIGIIIVYSLLLFYTINQHIAFIGEHATVMDYFLPFSCKILDKLYLLPFLLENKLLRITAISLILCAISFFVLVFRGLLKKQRWSIWAFLIAIIVLTARFSSMFLLVFRDINNSNVFGYLFLLIYILVPIFLFYCVFHCIRSLK